MKIKLFDYNGKEQTSIDIEFVEPKNGPNIGMIMQYLRAYLSSQRQGTAKAKNKAEASGGGKKPWRQKGTGRARVGSIRSPLWVGGGVSHGPQARNWELSLSKKMKKLSFSHSVFAKAQSDSVCAFTYTDNSQSTKNAVKFIKTLKKESPVLIIHNNNENLFRSFRNIPFVSVKSIENVNTFDIFRAKNIFIEKQSVEALGGRL